MQRASGVTLWQENPCPSLFLTCAHEQSTLLVTCIGTLLSHLLAPPAKLLHSSYWCPIHFKFYFISIKKNRCTWLLRSECFRRFITDQLFSKACSVVIILGLPFTIILMILCVCVSPMLSISKCFLDSTFPYPFF